MHIDPNQIIEHLKSKYKDFIKEARLLVTEEDPSIEWQISIYEKPGTIAYVHKLGLGCFKDGLLSMACEFVDFATFLQDPTGYFGDVEPPLEYTDVFRPEYLTTLKRKFYTLATMLEAAFSLLHDYNRCVCRALGFHIEYRHWRGDCESFFYAELGNVKNQNLTLILSRIDAFMNFIFELRSEIDRALSTKEAKEIIERERDEVAKREQEGEWLKVDEQFLKSLGLDVKPRMDEEVLIVS